MKNYTFDEIAHQYTESCKVMKECTLSGDYKRNNAEGRKLINIFKFLEKNIVFAEEVLPTFFNNENEVLRVEAASQCLSLKIVIQQAVSTIEEVAKNESYGIFAFNAKMTLKTFEEQGYIKIYPNQIFQ